MIFRIETELDFSNCQRILIQRLSIAIDAENLENVTQFAALSALAALLDRVGFLVPLGTPRYHTFVIGSHGWLSLALTIGSYYWLSCLALIIGSHWLLLLALMIGSHDWLSLALMIGFHWLS